MAYRSFIELLFDELKKVRDPLTFFEKVGEWYGRDQLPEWLAVLPQILKKLVDMDVIIKDELLENLSDFMMFVITSDYVVDEKRVYAGRLFRGKRYLVHMTIFGKKKDVDDEFYSARPLMEQLDEGKIDVQEFFKKYSEPKRDVKVGVQPINVAKLAELVGDRKRAETLAYLLIALVMRGKLMNVSFGGIGVANVVGALWGALEMQGKFPWEENLPYLHSLHALSSCSRVASWPPDAGEMVEKARNYVLGLPEYLALCDSMFQSEPKPKGFVGRHSLALESALNAACAREALCAVQLKQGNYSS